MIHCSNLKCRYWKNDKCKCKNIDLTFWNVATINMGRKDFLECKSFEYSEEYLYLMTKIKELKEK